MCYAQTQDIMECVLLYVPCTQSGDHTAQGDQGFVDAATFLQPGPCGACGIHSLAASQVHQVDLTLRLTWWIRRGPGLCRTENSNMYVVHMRQRHIRELCDAAKVSLRMQKYEKIKSG